MYKEYWKSRLNTRCQTLYDKMVCEFGKMNEQVKCDSFSLEEISNTYIAVYNDYPEFFYLPHNPQLQHIKGAFLGGNTLIARFIYSRAQIEKLNHTINRIKALFIKKRKELNSSLELEREVVDYCLQNFSYAVDNVYNQNAAQLLVNNIGQCSGISKAVKLIMDVVSIPTIIVSGSVYDSKKNKYEAHSWNIVNINGFPYHLDITMMMGGNLTKTQPFRYTYFNLSDSEIIKNHTWNKAIVPSCLERMTADNLAFFNVQANDIIYYEVQSMLEFKRYLKEKITCGKYDITVKNRITGYTDNNLIKLYCSAMAEILKQFDSGGRYEISIANDIVKIRFFENDIRY